MSINSYEQASRDFEGTEARSQAAETADEDVALDFLATLSPFDYDRTRKKEAQRLGVRVAELDRAVGKRREQLVSAAKPSGDGSQLVDFEPSKEPVNGERMICRLIETIKRYVVLPYLAAVVIALWIIRAHAHECFDVNPRLALLSPEKRCGKTTLLELLAALTPRALLVSNVTPATLYRVIESTRPVLLIDELDSFKEAHEELRGIMNSGHRRAAAFVLRCVGDEHDVKSFSTWCPMAYAMIGDPPDTLKDRSLSIRMRRRAKTEIVHRLRWTGQRGKALRASFTALGQGVARWVHDHADALQQQDPAVPEQLHDRAADNWTPLLAIADEIGGEWPERARAAAIAISGSYDPDNDSFSVQLLNDIRTVFRECDVHSLSSQEVCDRLVAMEESPWESWRHGRPLSQIQLARLLRPFEIVSRDLWLNKRSVKGYGIEDFGDAFDRYLPSVSSPSLKPGVLKREDARPDQASRGLADQKGGVSDKVQDGGLDARLHELSKLWRRVKPIKPKR